VRANPGKHSFASGGFGTQAHLVGEQLRLRLNIDLAHVPGKDLDRLSTADLAPMDEFHIRGRKATLELVGRMEIDASAHFLDIGSGLGGPARTLAEAYGCRVTGIDLSAQFCEAARELSRWVGLSDKVAFSRGDAMDLPYAAGTFDAAMTLHTAMNIADKDMLYAGVRRVLKPDRIFAVYDVLQGEGGEALYPVPWAPDRSISHLVTPNEMRGLLEGAGFRIEAEEDSTEASEAWFRHAAAQMAASTAPPVGLRQFLGDAIQMTRNQVRNLVERRIRTITYICRS
jgi:ubiquinone/menaquinone biosynthesis C-methylase UbiE